MTSETQRASEKAAYQLGWMAYERGDTDCLPDTDEAFLEMCEESLTCESENTIIMAYRCGFEDALRVAIKEIRDDCMP